MRDRVRNGWNIALSLVLLCGFGGDAHGQSLPDFWDDLEPATTGVVTVITAHPDSEGGWVTVSAGQTLLDAVYWAGDSPFIKQYRLEPASYRAFTSDQEEPISLATEAGGISLLFLEIAEPDEGRLGYVGSDLNLDPELVRKTVEARFPDEIGAGIGHDVTRLRPEGNDLRLSLVPDRRPTPPPNQ